MRETFEGRRHSLATFRFVVSLFVVLVIAFVIGQAVTYYSIRSERERQVLRLCRNSNEGRAALRSILVLAQTQSDNPNSSFWGRSLNLVKPVDCENVIDGG